MSILELEKCKIDPIYFIEYYCQVNGHKIKLKDYQIKFINWLHKL